MSRPSEITPYDALVQALRLAVDAPDDSRASRAVELAESLIASFGISEHEVRRAQAEVTS